MQPERATGSEPAVPPAPAGPPGPAAPAGRPSFSPDRALALVSEFLGWLSRPRVRLAVIGAVLLLTGGVFMTSSVWTLPLVVVGALMVAIAWIGRRLDGRLAIEWGDSGTQLEFRAKIKAPQPAEAASAGPPATSHRLVRVIGSEPGHAGIIDGEAHTVEIEVSELEALIAAVEQTEAHIPETEGSGDRSPAFRVGRGAAGASDPAR